jgi:hypothetical protein
MTKTGKAHGSTYLGEKKLLVGFSSTETLLAMINQPYFAKDPLIQFI